MHFKAHLLFTFSFFVSMMAEFLARGGNSVVNNALLSLRLMIPYPIWPAKELNIFTTVVDQKLKKKKN